MLKLDGTEPALTRWALLVVVISKTSNNLSLCVYYGSLEAVILLESDQLRRGDECLESLKVAESFLL